MSIAALAAAVLAGGLYAGFELRKRRLGTQRNPYRAYERDKVRDTETGNGLRGGRDLVFLLIPNAVREPYFQRPETK